MIVLLLTLAILAVGVVGSDAIFHWGPKSDAERMAEVCGPDPQNAWIEPDGTVCCDLCGL